MTLIHQTPHAIVTIGGVAQDTPLEWHTDGDFGQIATADIALPLPLSAEVLAGAEVVIEAAADADDAAKRVFWGTVRAVEPGIGDDGRVAHLRCSGTAWALTLPLEADLAFAGGADVDARLMTGQVIHIGDDTVSWYADTGTDGLTFDLLFNPKTDARFVRIEGRLHGTNSYQQEPDRDLVAYSRVEIWQAGRRRGYANLPKDSERYADQLDYANDANWADFALTIGARIDADDEVTVRFTSGRKPGSSERDEYEVKGITYAIAGRSTARDLIRSVLRDRGYGAAGNGIPYRVDRIADIAGGEIRLGGNALVNNGKIVLSEQTAPWDWLADLVDLWEARLVDGPDGIAVVAARGAPPSTATVAAAFTEGANLFAISSPHDTESVATYWTAYGASGTDENGEPFQYKSDPALESIATPSFLPDPPGRIAGEARSDLLVSDELARSVREIKEAEYEDVPVVVQMTTLPTPSLVPGSVIRVIAPTHGLDRLLWVTAVRHDWDDGGFWTSIEARAATGTANAEAEAAFDPEDQTTVNTKHIGQTDISWYDHVGADGLSVALAWHPGGAYRGVRVTGRYHGANSWPVAPTPAELLPEPERGIAKRYMGSVYATDDYLHDDIERFGSYGGEDDAEPFADYIRLAIDEDADPADVTDAYNALPDVLKDFGQAVADLANGTGTRGAVNRYTTAKGNNADTPSTVEVWQLGVRMGSAPLPWHGEAYDRRRDYDQDQYWADYDLMIAADVVDASAEIRFVSGTSWHGVRDEYEVKQTHIALYAEATEVGSQPNSGADWHAYQAKRVWRRAS